MARVLLALLCSALAFGTVACAETGTLERASTQLEEARRVGVQKDQQIRVLQWQLAVLDQQFRAAEQRNESVQQTLSAELQKIGAANLELTDRLNRTERERAALLATAAEAPIPSTREPYKTHDAGPRAEELRRMIAAFDARNAQILEQLGRIERLLANRPTARSEPPPRLGGAAEVIDPWGFGSRK